MTSRLSLEDSLESNHVQFTPQSHPSFTTPPLHLLSLLKSINSLLPSGDSKGQRDSERSTQSIESRAMNTLHLSISLHPLHTLSLHQSRDALQGKTGSLPVSLSGMLELEGPGEKEIRSRLCRTSTETRTGTPIPSRFSLGGFNYSFQAWRGQRVFNSITDL